MAVVFLGGVLALVVTLWMIAEIFLALLITMSIRESEGRPMFKKLKGFLANNPKIVSVIKGAGIAVGGVVVTAATELVSTGALGAFGPWGLILSAAASVLINATRKGLVAKLCNKCWFGMRPTLEGK